MATRLRTEDRFLEAQNWSHYLFDPQAPADPDNGQYLNPKPAYWRCRPLSSAGNLGCETRAPTDPDAIGYSAPRHFQILVFSEYVKNLMAWGDWYYRQLTRDSLVAAKLCYVQAEFLMGKAPAVRTVNRWETDTVDSLMNKSMSRPALEQFEQNLAFSLADFPAAAEAPPLLGLLANEPFKAPINEQLLALYDLPGQRLHNLRNNLTLDGKPLELALFSPPTDPNALLSDLAAGGSGAPRPMGGRLVVGGFPLAHDVRGGIARRAGAPGTRHPGAAITRTTGPDRTAGTAAEPFGGTGYLRPDCAGTEHHSATGEQERAGAKAGPWQRSGQSLMRFSMTRMCRRLSTRSWRACRSPKSWR
nr:hypothetical protein GCM10020185_51910 [Pseudomonas brassicacearum subsp. brassicacearum]